jgi:hypothetical protein
VECLLEESLAFQPEVQAGFVLLMLALTARTLVELGKEALWSLSQGECGPLV